MEEVRKVERSCPRMRGTLARSMVQKLDVAAWRFGLREEKNLRPKPEVFQKQSRGAN